MTVASLGDVIVRTIEFKPMLALAGQSVEMFFYATTYTRVLGLTFEDASGLEIVSLRVGKELVLGSHDRVVQAAEIESPRGSIERRSLFAAVTAQPDQGVYLIVKNASMRPIAVRATATCWVVPENQYARSRAGDRRSWKC